MNRKLLPWGIALALFVLNTSGARGQTYEFAAVSNSITAGANLNAVANNGNTFVCVGAVNSPVLAVNSNNFAAFAAGNAGGGYLLFSNAWTNTLKSPIKYAWLNCVAAQSSGFIASGASNTVLVSADGVNWTNWGHILAAGEQAYSADGIAYNPVSDTYAAALAVYEASWMTNPISTNVWQVAGLQGESFSESFRGVTSFASSNMAMCGIFGDIRVSSDGGKNWKLSQQVNSILPNLLSVASDGGSNLVCAGDYSMLEVSTNGGPTASSWIFQTNFNFGLSGNVTNFNAVAYAPVANEFLAAGSIGANGLIAMAPESSGSANWKWTRQTNLWQYQDGILVPRTTIGSALNGVALANSGFFQGISMLVGDSGTVMIGGYSPPAPVNALDIDITNVLTNPLTNNVLAATVVADANHPANILTVDWYSSASEGTPVAFNQVSYQPTNESCGTYTNWAEERDLRTGFVSTNRTAFVFTIIPGAPGDPMSATNCSPIGQPIGGGLFGMCDQTPLSVTVVTNAANPPGTIQVNWYEGPGLVLMGTTVNSIYFNSVMTFIPVIYPAFASSGGVLTFYAQATNPATGFASTNLTELTYQVNPLPVWTSTNALATNGTFISLPVISAPSITAASASAIATVDPAAQIEFDWYTNGDPAMATLNNPEAPLVATGPSFTPTNQLCGTYTYYVRARVYNPEFTGCICQSTNLVPVTFTLLPPAPVDAIVNLTNVLTGTVQANTPIWVDLATNADNPPSNFVVNWYSAATGGNNLNDASDTNLNNRFFHTPTNAACGVFTNWAETMAINTGSGGPAVSTNRLPVVFAIIPATPTAIGVTDVTNCIEIPAPTFTVTVTNGQTANWYDSSGTPVASGMSFTPTNSLAGTWTYAAEATDPLSGLVSTGSVLATLSLYDCTNPLAISLNPANGTGTIQWPGNLTLLSTTNLTPPIVWSSVATGSVFSAGGNTLTFTNTNPPVEFFRLTN